MPVRVRNQEAVSIIPATTIFTDREEPRAVFRRLLAEAGKTRGDYHVLHFYGRGGIGKTSLLKVLCEKTLKEKGTAVLYDMEDGTEMRRVLTRLRNMLLEGWPSLFSFDLFDLALLRFSQLAGEQNELVLKENQTILDTNPVLAAALESASYIPGISLASSVISALNKGYNQLRDIGDYRRQNLLKKASGVEKLPLRDLLEKLPEYFSEDLAASCRDLEQPLVIFLDTYEKLVNYMAVTGIAGEEDRWLRDEIIQYVPNCIWVIAGRDRLRWLETDPLWKDDPYYEDHLLEQLGETDSLQYLLASGIADPDVRRALYEYTEGDPYALELAAGAWLELSADGKTPRLTDLIPEAEYAGNAEPAAASGFNTAAWIVPAGTDFYSQAFFRRYQEMVRRYLRDMDSAHRDLAELLACLGQWTEEDVTALAPALLGAYRPRDYETLCTSSLIRQDRGHYFMPRIVRDSILSQMPPDLLAQYLSAVSAARNVAEKPFSLDYSAEISRELERLAEILRCGTDPGGAGESIRKLQSAIGKLELQGNYREVHRLLLPLYRYEDSAGFRDTEVFPLLQSYLYALTNDDLPERSYKDTKALYDMAQARHVSGAPADRLDGLMLDALNNTRRYTEMLDLAAKLKQKAEAKGRDDFYYSTLTAKYGNALSVCRRYSEAIPVLEEALRRMRKEIADKRRDSLDITDSLNHLGVSCREAGQLQKALEADQERTRIHETVFGPDHLRTLASLSNLAIDHSLLKDDAKAEEVLCRIIESGSAHYGESNQTVLRAMNNLAVVYSREGKRDESFRLSQKVYELKKAKYPPGHPYYSEVCTSLHSLAYEYGLRGDKAAEKKMNEEALQGFHDAYSSPHPESLPTIRSLASAYDTEAEYAKGEEVCREGLALAESFPSFFSSKASDVSWILAWLGYYLRLQKKYGEAEGIARRFLEHTEKHDSGDIKNRLRAYLDLSRNLRSQGKKEEALQYAAKGLAFADAHPESKKLSPKNLAGLQSIADSCR